MSKILRRPMFRGGGPVSSYGNGITAPLVPGYQGGGQIGGGIIYGKPMADGRYGFGQPNIKDFMPQIDLGANVAELANKKVSAMSPIVTDIEDTDYLPAGVVLQSDELIKTKEPDKQESKTLDYNTGFGESEVGITDQFGEGLEILTADEEYANTIDTILKKIEIGKRLSSKEEKIRIEEKIKDYNEITNLGETQITKNEILSTQDTSGNDLPPSLRGIDSIPDLTKDKSVIDDTEEVEISAKDAIAENQELFKELLGSKKARGQDISDMLLRFSGSQGNTLGEKFQNYTRAESAAGPGRGEKINQTAAALAINDYVAGKRSKESLDTLLAKTDYDYKKKGELTDVQASDSLFDAKSKIARTYKEDMNSTKMIKYLINFKTGREDIYSPPGIKEKDFTDKRLKKTLKKLKKGYNIYDEGGVKKIVLYDGSGNTDGLQFIELSKIWEG